MKGVMRFGKKGKLSPWCIGPFEILEKIGLVAYRVALPPTLFRVHDMFHVSILRKYMPDPSHVLIYEPLESENALAYEEVPVQILDQKVQKLHIKEIPSVKVVWQNTIEEASWELETEIRLKYPHLFRDT
ncbi:uncharacterized protein LOC131158539 [Malania oleifera]|uniref:uncharacterized protein LOC131158539 n=1 Tax=Malania oleifera TaxID=397392 RepID=UPI0025AE262E|nr:uncharacterized protein LOC131158539 [Malania oleifera]